MPVVALDPGSWKGETRSRFGPLLGLVRLRDISGAVMMMGVRMLGDIRKIRKDKS